MVSARGGRSNGAGELGEKKLYPEIGDSQNDSSYSCSKNAAHKSVCHSEVEWCRSRQVGKASERADSLGCAVKDGCVENDEQE